ncbi:hypothetical protein N9329_03660 [Gammaproteobacteria bacterium]|jgi:hypothetical protein|nr:hypothetical protein [Gammaproteobacteria bacterium]MBT6482908.1 hypothetical protein [Gammaproteobacteria bacterium]MBT7225009.1 hypothetical protein [Gammaproteobacteria bacterium]MDB3898498.1 hypothetical protein [Gammaproteobacteria bacterium]
MLRKRLLPVCAALCSLLLFSGSVLAEVNSVFISSRLDPNAIIITEVDIIFIYDEEIANALPDTKSAWYSNKRGFTRDAGDKMDIVNVFIPQGFDSEMASLPVRRAEALQVLVYAYHDDSKATPRDITDTANVLIEIDPFGIRVSSRD